MAQLALTAGGAVAGGIAGSFIPGVGTLLGAQIGALAGSVIGGLLFAPGTPGLSSPRVGDLKVMVSSYGQPIPICYGTIRIAAQIIGATNLIPKDNSDSVGGGLGMGGPTTPATITYSMSLSALLCEGPLSQGGAIDGVLRIWGDNKKIWDSRPGAHKANKRGAAIRIHKGSSTEMPDPWEQSYFGADVCPGYRGRGRMVIDHIQLADFANHPPNLTAEVVTKATALYPYQFVDPGGGTDFSIDTAIDLDSRLLVKYGFGGDMSVVDIDTVEVLLGPITVTAAHVGNCVFGPDGFLYAPMGSPNDPGIGIYDYVPWAKIDPNSLQIVEEVGWVGHTFDDANHDGLGLTTILKNRGYPYILGKCSIGLPTFSSYGAIVVSVGQLEALLDPASPAAGHLRFVAKTEASGGPDPGADDWEIDPSSIKSVTGVGGAPAFTFDLWGVYGDVSSHTCTLWRMTATDNLAIGGGVLVGAANGVNPVILADTTDLTSDWSVNGGARMTYLEEEHSLIVSRGNKLLKYNLDSLTVTGAELTIPSVFSTTGSELVQGPINGMLACGGPGGAHMYLVDCINWAIAQDVLLTNFNGAFDLSSQKMQDDCTIWIRGTGTQLDKLDICSLNPGVVTLGEIVSDLCQRGGMSTSDFDVTELTEEVRGFAVSRQMSARDAIASLALPFNFIGIEVDHKLKFIHRGGAPAATLQLDDIGAYSDGKSRPQPLMITDADPRTIPRRVTVKYINSGALYQDGLQAEQRHQAIVQTVSETAIDVPVVFHDDEAKAVASTQLWKAWTNARKFDFTTSRAFLALSAGDVIEIVKDGNAFRMELAQVDMGADGTLHMPAVQDDAAVYISPVSSTGGGSSGVTPGDSPLIGHTDFELMDIVLLADSHDGKGFYVAAAPNSGNLDDWTAGNLLKSVDNGVSYSIFLTITKAAVIGRATTVLASPARGAWDVWDRDNSFTVRLFDPSNPPASASELAVLNGANLALLGNEVIQFATAVDNGDGTFTLSTLLRAIRGSDPFIGTHALGDRFVILDTERLRNVLVDPDFGAARFYKSQSVGADSIAKQVTAFADTGVRLKPLSPVSPALQTDANGNLLISWIRRTRIGGENDWGDGVTDVPLGEASESYQIDILNGSTVIRTLTVGQQSAAYMLDQQVADFGSAQTSLHVVIYQVSATVGRGFGTDVTLSVVGAYALPVLGTPIDPSTEVGVEPYDLVIEWLDVAPIPADQVVGFIKPDRAITIPAGLGGSVGKSIDAATTQTDIDLRKNGASFGTVRFGAAGTIPTFISTLGASFNGTTDYLQAVAPHSSDATLGRLTISIKATRAA